MRSTIEFRHLKYFLVAAEELHFGRAAERLHIAQPSLSQQIRELERQVKTKLFERSTRRVELTAAGIALREHARELLAKLDDAVLSVQRAGGEPIDHLKLATISPATYRFLPMVLRRFRTRFPATHLAIRTLYSQQVVTALEQGEVHVGLTRPPQSPGRLRFHTLFSERFVAILPKQHRLARRSILVLEDFRGEAIIHFERPEILGFTALQDTLIAHGLTFDERLSIGNTLGAIALTSAGAGISFLPEWVKDLVTHDIAIRHVEDIDLTIDLAIGWRADDPAPGIDPFIDIARMAARTWGRAPSPKDEAHS